MSSSYTIQYPDSFRTNIRKKIDVHFNDMNLSTNLERGVFNYALKEAEQRKVIKKWDNTLFVHIYLSHLKSVLVNLSPKLIHDVKNKVIKPHTIAFMTHQELNHERWAELIDIKS